MKTAHYATLVAMQNAMRLSDSGNVLGTTDAIILGGILFATLVICLWVRYKA